MRTIWQLAAADTPTRWAERVVAGSGLRCKTLRATHALPHLMFKTAQQMARMPVVPVPSGSGSSRSTLGEVADRLVELALGPPAGQVADLAGDVRGLREARAHVPLPGQAARAVRAGAKLAPDGALGRGTREHFLAGSDAAPVRT